jgi:large subunit ribosomal protein L1
MIKNLKSNQLIYKINQNSIINVGIAKLSFETKKIIDNIQYFIKTVQSSTMCRKKNMSIINAFISTSQGPSIRLDLKNYIV